MAPLRISVVVPAFNEELYLSKTLRAIERAATVLRARRQADAELIVVNNGSTDGTARIASSFGARVVEESEHNIARVRNRGAAAARGETLVFIDADTLIPEELLARIHELRSVVGGAVGTDYRPSKRSARLYLALWRVVGKAAGLAQGATQFCQREVFEALGGYGESLYMGEDVDFYRRLRRAGPVRLIDDVKVVPSCRRFDRWPLWRTLLWTNPLVIAAFRRARSPWRGWYRTPMR